MASRAAARVHLPGQEPGRVLLGPLQLLRARPPPASARPAGGEAGNGQLSGGRLLTTPLYLWFHGQKNFGSVPSLRAEVCRSFTAGMQGAISGWFRDALSDCVHEANRHKCVYMRVNPE